MASLQKDADAVLDFGWDWGALDASGASWLGDDVITESTWRAVGCDIATTPPPSHDGRYTKVWLTGGTVGDTAQVTNRIRTTAGRVDERTLHVLIVKR